MVAHKRSEHSAAVLDAAGALLDVIYGDEPVDCVTAWRLLHQVVQMLQHARDLELLHALDHGHTQTEYARALGISQQAMQQRTGAARRRVAAHLDAHGGGS